MSKENKRWVTRAKMVDRISRAVSLRLMVRDKAGAYPLDPALALYCIALGLFSIADNMRAIRKHLTREEDGRDERERRQDSRDV